MTQYILKGDITQEQFLIFAKYDEYQIYRLPYGDAQLGFGHEQGVFTVANFQHAPKIDQEISRALDDHYCNYQ